MPTYTYACDKCGHRFDVFHPMTANPRIKCEDCGSSRCKRQIGTGAGIIFKGSGFYETDYKSKKGSAAVTDSGAPGKDEAKGKDKSASESKTEGKSKTNGKSKTDSSGSSKPAAASAKD